MTEMTPYCRNPAHEHNLVHGPACLDPAAGERHEFRHDKVAEAFGWSHLTDWCTVLVDDDTRPCAQPRDAAVHQPAQNPDTPTPAADEFVTRPPCGCEVRLPDGFSAYCPHGTYIRTPGAPLPAQQPAGPDAEFHPSLAAQEEEKLGENSGPDADPDGAFEGHEGRECGEHRSTGYRAWCYDCSEWCSSLGPCARCELPVLRGLLQRVSTRVRHDHAYPMEIGPHHCPGCDLEAEIAAVLEA